MKQHINPNGWIAKLSMLLKGNRKLELVVYGCIVLAVLGLYLSSVLTDDKQADVSVNTNMSADTAAQSEHQIEERLKEVLSRIRGAGAVEVMITYDTGKELVPAMSIDTNTNRSETTAEDRSSTTEQETQSQKPATISGNGGSEPIVLMEKQPTIRGVIVVAEGAADIAVKLDLQRAVQTVLDVPIANIEVFELARDAKK